MSDILVQTGTGTSSPSPATPVAGPQAPSASGPLRIKVMSDGFFFSLEGPLDSLPVGRQIRAGNLTGFSELVRGLGAEPRELFERHGIDPRLVRDPDAYINSQAPADLLEDCSRIFNDPLFGLRLAQLQEPDVFGSVATLCRSASSFREALTSFADFIPIMHCPQVGLELLEGQETTELRWSVHTEGGHHDQAKYKGMMMVLKLLQQVGGRGFKPSYVHLGVDPRSRDLPELAQRFGCRFRGRTTTSAIAFPTAALELPVVSANRLLFKLLGGYLDRVRSSSRRSVVERVEDYVRGALSSGNCSIEHCARKLGSSVRALQLALSNQGLSFSDIVERQRMTLAKTCLERGGMTLDQVAAVLGYSEQSSFGRAFKRWTGSSPQHYRRQLELAKAA